MSPNQELLAWVKDNPGAPSWWIAVAKRMARSLEMKQAWPSLIEAGAKPVQVLAMVTASLEGSVKDVRRKPAKDEKDAVEAVRKSANELLKALQGAQLLGDGAPIIEIGKTLAAVSWTDRQAGLPGRDPAVVSLPELLRGLEARCDDLINDPPLRAIDRLTRGPERSWLRAFVRRLDFHFKHEFGQTTPENLTRIANSILAPNNAVTGREVSGFIEDSPLTG